MKIRYVSGVPGLGKTRWCLRQVTRRVVQGKGLTIYVAPTKELLHQFKEDLQKMLGDKGVTDASSYIAMITSSSKYSVSPMLLPQVIEKYFEGELTTDDFMYLPTPSKQTVMLLTHETFYKLHPSAIPDTYKDTAHVYFDEAKKSVFRKSLVSINAACTRILNRLVSFSQLKGTSYFLVTRKEAFDPKEVIRKLTKNGLSYKSIPNLLNILEYVNCTSVNVFLSRPKFESTNNLYCITMPSKVFDGYKHVTLMAAHLEYSQMFFLLKSKVGVKMIDVTYKIKNFKSRFKGVLERYSNVTIVPLTNQTSPVSLSKLSRCLLPIADAEIMAMKLGNKGVQAKSINKALRYLTEGNPHADKDSSEVQFVYKALMEAKNVIVTDSMKWYIRSADAVRKAWVKANVPEDKRKYKTSLLFLNNKYLSDIPENSTSFKHVSTYCHGINTHSKVNVATYLAAINPEGPLVNFLRNQLGSDYDYMKDYIADTCMQCITRTSVRNTKSRDKVLIIVPDVAIANLLLEFMYHKPTVDMRYADKLGDMHALSSKSPSAPRTKTMTDKQRKELRNEKERLRKEHTAYKHLNTLRVRRHRVKAGTYVGCGNTVEEAITFINKCLKDGMSNEEYLRCIESKLQSFNLI